MDDPMSETGDLNSPYFVIAPAFPKGVIVAGITWIVIGAFILLLLVWMVLLLALPTANLGNSQEDLIVATILMAIVLGSLAFGFIFVGIRTAAGVASDTLASGIGSTLVGSIYLITFVAIAAAPADEGGVVAESCFGLSVGTALLVPGILAL